MKDEKFLNGTGKGAKTEPATKESSAQNGTTAGFAEVDDNVLSAITGGAPVPQTTFYCERCGHLISPAGYSAHSQRCRGGHE